MEWKDTTSYSRGEKERKPNTWTVKNGGVSITVTCGHIHHPGAWIMHCSSVGMDTRYINAKSLEEAKAIAVDDVLTILRGRAKAVEEIAQNMNK